MSIVIADNAARRRYVATAGQTVFSIPFEFFANTDLKVFKNGTLLALTTNYTLTGAGVSGGGNLTLVAGAALSDDILIVLDLPVERTANFSASGPFDIVSLNTQLAKLTLMIQHLETDLARRTLHLGITDAPETMGELPTKAVRAGKFMAFDAAGNPTAEETNDALDAAVASAGLDADAAQVARIAAETALATALAILDSFDDRYLGPKNADPLFDNDGNELIPGAIYFNTILKQLKAWTGTEWVISTSVVGTGFLPLAGGNMLGQILLFADPSALLHPATKQYTDAADALKAPLLNPAFSGNPTAPTQAPGNSSTRLATTEFVALLAALKANLASPTFTGVPLTPTAAARNKTDQIASTNFAVSEVNTVAPAPRTTTAETLALTDAGKLVTLTNAGAIALTVPTNAVVPFPVGTRIDLGQDGAGQVTVGGAGITFKSNGNKRKLSGQFSGATLWQEAINVWWLFGDLTT